MNQEDALVVFQGKGIRRIWHENEWWFSIADVIEILTESTRPRKYWNDLKRNLSDEGFELSAKIGQLKMVAGDGKKYLTDCATTECMFRIIKRFIAL